MKPGSVRHERLPPPADYFAKLGMRLTGGAEWKSTTCPFHDDHQPSLRIHMPSGAFRCMVCGEKGGDLIAFHMRLKGLRFIDACKALGVWDDTNDHSHNAGRTRA